MSCLFICYISYHIIPFQSILKNSNNLVLEILNQFKVDTLYFKLFYYLNSNNFTIRYSESIKGNSHLKTVSAFNNSDGGKLLIGVSDDKEILGLQNDYNTLREGNRDHFELHLRNLLNNSFAKEYISTNVRIHFPIVEDEEVCLVDIKYGTKPLFLEVKDRNGNKHKKFYVRSGNSSQELDIVETSEYIKKRF